MTKDGALKLALEALETSLYPQQPQLKAIAAIKAALTVEQEPVAWEQFYPDMGKPQLFPPQRTWVDLTDEDWNRSKHNYDFQKGVDWAESILKEKNT